MSRKGDCDPRYLRYVNSRNQRFKNYEFVKDRASSKVGRSLTSDGKVDTTVERNFYRRRGGGRERSRSRSRSRSRAGRNERRIRGRSRRRGRRKRSTTRSGSNASRQSNLDDFVQRTPAKVYGPSKKRRKTPATQSRIDDYFGRDVNRRGLVTGNPIVDADPKLTTLSSSTSNSDDDQLTTEELPLSYRQRSRRRRRRRRINSDSSDSDNDEVGSSHRVPVIRSDTRIGPNDQSELARQVRSLRVVDLSRIEPLNPENRGTRRG